MCIVSDEQVKEPTERFVSSEEIFLSAAVATSRPAGDAEDEKTALVTPCNRCSTKHCPATWP